MFPVLRQGYRKYTRSYYIAAVLYVVAVAAIALTAQLVLALVVGGVKDVTITIGIVPFTPLQLFALASLHAGILLVYIGLITLFACVVSMFFRNIYFAHIFPVLSIVVAPVVLGSTLANLFPAIGEDFVRLFIPVRTLSVIPASLFIQSEDPFGDWIYAFATSMTFGLLFIVLNCRNNKVFSRDYL